MPFFGLYKFLFYKIPDTSNRSFYTQNYYILLKTTTTKHMSRPINNDRRSKKKSAQLNY